MYQSLQYFHSKWAYVALILIFLASINSLIKWVQKKDFSDIDKKLALFALISSHVQLLLGLILLFLSPYWTEMMADFGIGMKNKLLRLYVVEHPFTNIIAIALITLGWSKHKKVWDGLQKNKKIAIYYALGFVLLLSRIPWHAWFNN